MSFVTEIEFYCPSVNPQKHFISFDIITYSPLYIILTVAFINLLTNIMTFPCDSDNPHPSFSIQTHILIDIYGSDEWAPFSYPFVVLESSTWNAYPKFKSIISNWMHTNRPTYSIMGFPFFEWVGWTDYWIDRHMFTLLTRAWDIRSSKEWEWWNNQQLL